jgi:predicted ATPase/DNA-binding SARP family transcriptional activator
MMRLDLFGAPALVADGATHALPFERRHQLVAFLALKRAWVARAEIAALLWPDQSDRLASTNLRKALFRLQSSERLPRIDADGGALRLVVDTDVAAFEQALRDERLADAVTLRRGELLAGYDDDTSEAWSGWLRYERGRLRDAWRGAALRRLDAGIDADEGIALSAKLLDVDALDEAALKLHLAWLAKGGQAARARAAYREFVRRLDAELGIAPGAELRAMHDALGAARAPERVPVLPADDGFIGRTAELKRLAGYIARDDCRLVTLVGPGGVGKTRLARRVLDDHASFGDGVAFVPLDDLATSGELATRLARELGVRLAGSGDPLDQVVAHLRERAMLLALDNFEQLAGDAATLQRILDACPRVKLVVTSRVRLALPGEWLLPLSGLPWPDAEDVDRFEAFDAVRLFVRAAQRVEPALVPVSEAAAILDICRRVEGLPLALELAASWTRVLSCEAIAHELREGTELLHAVDASRPARQASIEVVFDQSWKHLGAAEREVLARLSVFRGGFAPDAARAVCGAPLPVLGALADKSLVRKDGARLHLHPLVQQLAAQRLGDGEARDIAARAHAEHYLRMVARFGSAIADGDRDALLTVETEFENVRAAWRYAVTAGIGDLAARSAVVLLSFCDLRGRLEDGLALMREAAASTAAAQDASLHVLAEACASHLEYRLDRYPQALVVAEAAFAAADPERDGDAHVQALKTLAACSFRLGRLDDARRHYQTALDARPASVHPNHAAAMLDNLALIEHAMGNDDAALDLSRRSLAVHRQLGDAAGVALCLNNLGTMHMDLQDFAQAGVCLREGLAIAERQGLVATRTLVLINLAQVAVEIEDDDAAVAAVERAREAADASRNRVMVCWVHLIATKLCVRRGDPGPARNELVAALEIARNVQRPILQRSAIVTFAEVLAAQGETGAARRVLTFVAAHPATSNRERADIEVKLARLPGEDGRDLPWPDGLSLDALVERIAGEAPEAHAGLVALLRAPP